MRIATRFLIGLISVVFVAGAMGLVTPVDSEAKFIMKTSFPQAPLVKKWFQKTVCGFRNPGQRFVTSKDGKYVCDRTTGDVWEQNPNSFHPTTHPDGRMPMNWEDAKQFCADLGKTKGHGQVYELPSVQQLQDVLDYTRINPALTPGVFSNMQSAGYWSATLRAESPRDVWRVSAFGGTVGYDRKANPRLVWCVRGGKEAHADW